MTEVPAEVGEFLRRYDRYLVVGHVEPDGDCLASAVVLARLLERWGKEVTLADEGPFDRPEVASLRSLFRSELPRSFDGQTAVVVVDCSTEDRLGSLAEAVRGRPVLVIDHHASGQPFGSVRWIVPSAPAVCLLTQLLLERLGESIPAADAELLLFGLCTDTGFFRFLGEGSADTFQAASRLVAAGASPQRVYQKIHSGWNLPRIRLLADALRRAERVLGGQVLFTWWTLADSRKSGRQLARGSDEVYRILRGVEEVEVIVFARQEARRRFSVGFRSVERVDVGELAQALGGGGHARAAGCTLTGSLTEVRRMVLEELEPRMGSGAPRTGSSPGGGLPTGPAGPAGAGH
jgi:phosphoesterase RecJ-like protein